MAQKPPIGKDAFGVTSEAYRVRAEIDLQQTYDRLLNETRRLYADLSQQGLSGDALADRIVGELSNLSDRPVEEMARKATAESFNLGRNLAAQERLGEIGAAVRSEVLDENTCPPCIRLDGTIVRMNTPEYFQNMPPNGCDGRELCRGFYIYRRAA